MRMQFKNRTASVLLAVVILMGCLFVPMSAQAATGPIKINPAITKLPDAQLNSSYSISLNSLKGNSVTDATNTYVECLWYNDGALPSGLNLDQSGLITWTPNKLGTYTFKLYAIEKATMNTPAELKTVSATFEIIVIDQSKAPIIDHSNPALPDAYRQDKYSYKFTTSTGTGVTWSIVNAPAAIKNSFTLKTSGEFVATAVTAAVGVYTIDVKAKNGFGEDIRSFKIEVKSQALTITTTELPTATVGKSYSEQIEAEGRSTKVFTMNSTMPAGLSLNSKGVVSGTPKVPGTYYLDVKVTDAARTDRKLIKLIIEEYAVITTVGLADGILGVNYSSTLHYSGANPTWSVSSGKLPSGLTLNSTTGEISGKPNSLGNSVFSITAKGISDKHTKQYQINIKEASTYQVEILTSELDDATISVAYSYKLAASEPSQWFIESGVLPAGLKLEKTGVISGTPTAAESTTFTVRIENGNGTATKKLTLTVIDKKPSSLTEKADDAMMGAAYRFQLEAKGEGPITWRILDGALPEGLQLDEATGLISGTPVKVETATFTVEAANDYGSKSRSLTIAVLAPFTDIQDHWAKDDISWAYSEGYINGTSATAFTPNGALTRGMFITILYRYAGEPEQKAPYAFTDVPATEYYANAVAWGVEHGIVNGVSQFSFEPEKSITREDLVLILYRYAEYAGMDTADQSDLSSYNDTDEIGNWAEKALAWAVKKEIIKGTTSTAISPKGTATRAETTTIIRRFYALQNS